MRTHIQNVRMVTVLVAAMLAAHSASAVMVIWEGTNGVSPTTNWSDVLNWYVYNANTQTTPVANAANFTWATAVNTPGVVTVNVDGAYNTPGTGFAQSYGAFFGQTNGCHTVYIQPGVTWSIQASGTTPYNGTQGIGILVSPQVTNNNTIQTVSTVATGAAYTNYTTVTGIGGTWYCDGGANTGGLRVEAASTVANNHYSILDMSGLGTFYLTNITGLSSSCGFYLVNGGQNSQGLIYLAHTNIITLNNNFQVGYLGNTSSNTLPIGVYLGQSNYITTGANNNALVIGFTGCSNGFMKFNPVLLGGPTMPSAYITGTSGNQAAQICNASSGSAPGSATCDFTGGIVTWIGNSLKIGVSGTNSANTSANGVLTFGNGTITFNTILIGSQTVSSGAAAVGTVNIGTNATLVANTSITLGGVTGTANPGTLGTININTNGTLQASTVTNGGGGSTINMTNAILAVSLTSTNLTNIIVANVNAGGTTNAISITSITPILPGPLPLKFHIIATTISTNLVGASTFLVGSLPASSNPSYPYTGYIDSTNTPGLVDFVLTGAPPAGRTLTWRGLNGGTPAGAWDVATTPDWQTNNIATTYNQQDLAVFNDVTSPAQTNVSLTTDLIPYNILVSNNASLFTLGLTSDSGYLSGTTGLTKAGSGTLILDNGTANTFTGGITISGGILQVGNFDTGGNLPVTVAITDNSVLAYGRTDTVTVTNVISGSGAVVSGGGGTLHLGVGNSFTGPAVATNNSTLQGGIANAFGASNGTIVIANGSTFDPNGVGTLRPITVSGTGVGGNGAIVNSGGPIYDSVSSPIQMTPSITLTGDTTFSYPTRWDLGFPTGAPFPLNTGGHAYNLTMNGTGNNSYFEWREVQADSALANITVTAGFFGLTGASTLGSTNYSLNILNGANMKLYQNDSNSVVITKPLIVNDTATVFNESGNNTISGPLMLTNSGGNQYCVFQALASTLTVTGPLSGNGTLWMQGSTATLVQNGDASTFTGGVLIPSGTFTLNSTILSGITNSAGSILNGSGTANGNLDLSGAFVPGRSNVAGTFRAAGGLTFESSATPVINLTATTEVGGANSLVAVTGNLNVIGSPIIYINPIGTLVDGTYTLMTYTGTLNGTFGGVQTVNPSNSYSLTLNTNTPNVVQLIVNGAPKPATFTGPYTISGGTLTLTGTGGLTNGTYRVYTSTNLIAPFTNWTELGSGSFDGGGNFSFPTTVTNGPQRFYILEEP